MKTDTQTENWHNRLASFDHLVSYGELAVYDWGFYRWIKKKHKECVDEFGIDNIFIHEDEDVKTNIGHCVVFCTSAEAQQMIAGYIVYLQNEAIRGEN